MVFFLLQVRVPFFVMVPVPDSDPILVPFPDQTLSQSQSRHISGPGLCSGPGPVIFQVLALVPVPVPVISFGPVTQCVILRNVWPVRTLAKCIYNLI